MAFKAAPLPHEWMITSIIGFFISLLMVYPAYSKKWGAAFMLIFVLMFIAAVVSMSNATTEPEHLETLAARKRH